jgi:addiction module HigA family antidote
MKKKVRFKPTHPGIILQEALNGASLSQSKLATHIGVTQSKINEICRGKRGLSIEMCAKLGRAFGLSTEFWYNAQKQFELDSLDETEFLEIDKIAA